MTRFGIAAGAVGLFATLGWGAALLAGGGAMPCYFAGWLFWVGVPMGALALVLAADALSLPAGPVLAVLRRLVLLLPLAALFGLPVLFGAATLFRAARPVSGWFAPVAFELRQAVLLLALSGLALAGAARPRRPGVAAFCLLVDLCLTTVAAIDWVLAPQPGLASTLVGVLLMAAQVGTATSLACLVVATRGGAGLGRGPALLLGLGLGGWAFVHFLQYLTVWSANLPSETAWYAARVAGRGGWAVWLGVAAVASAVLLATPGGRRRDVVGAIAGLALAAHAVEAFWLVTPAYRGAFRIAPGDALAWLGLGGLTVFAFTLTAGREVRDARI